MPKTVLITGTSSGVGYASVDLFAEAGWNVIATLRDPDKVPDFRHADQVMVLRLEVEDISSIPAAVDAGIARFGRIDALVNNAGFGQYGLFEALDRDRIQRQFDVNVFGVMDVTRAILPHFRAKGGGVIVNVSSGAGIFGLPMISAYCASKFALDGFTEALSYELASQNIIAKLVIPHGGIDQTRFHERSAADFVSDDRLKDYDAFLARTRAMFGRMAGGRLMSAGYVAGVVVQAVTDDSRQLRYFVGDDARGFIKARQHNGDEDYMAHMRGFFEVDMQG